MFIFFYKEKIRNQIDKYHLVAPKINSQCLILLINLEAKKVYKRVNYYESCDCTEDKVNPNYCPIKNQTSMDTISIKPSVG